MKILEFSEWRRENSGTYRDYLAYAKPLEQVQDELDLITGTLPGTVFWSEYGEALFLHGDSTCVILVTPPTASDAGRARTHEAYLVSAPLENLIEASRDMTSSDIEAAKRFSSGWTC